MTHDTHIFSPTQSSISKPLVQTANGSHMHVNAVGQVSTSSISLSDTFHIPNLTLNLISVGQLCELGLTITFSSSGCHVQDPQT